MIREIHLSTAIKGLYFVLIVLCITAAFPSQGFSDSEPKTIEIMPGGPPIPLIAVPEDFFFRVVPSPERLSLFAQLATFSINYISSGTNYFGDTCISWPTEARNAFDYTASIWATYLQSSVPITINACWSTSLASGILGHSGSRNFFRNFSGAPMADTWYPVTLANALHGSDLDPGIADIEIAYSSTFNWYFATDGNPGSGQYDFVSVVLHEIAHGLGFAGSMTVSSGLGSWGFSTGCPVAYDRFTENGSGQDLINTSLFPNSSTALAAQLTSNNLYFNGTNADAANGGNRPKLYAPSTWASGSSYAHLDEIYNGTVNALMTYSLNFAEAMHDPGPITMGIFKDVGWTTSSCTYSIDPVNSPIFSLLGGSGSFNITTQSGCAWTTTESLDWVTITSGSSGTGSGTVTYSVSSNAGGERSGAITISGQSFTGTHTITQSGQATNLIQNSGFESGNTVWIQESGPYNIIMQSSETPVSAHNGSWLTWFGGYSNASDVLYQQITISSWATQAYVQFWYYIATQETSGQIDIMTVEIRRNSDNTLLKTLKTFSNLDSTSGWVQSQQFDVTEFIGQTIRLRFAATLNATNNTNFFIDDVTLMVTSVENIYISPDGSCGAKTPCFTSIQNGINSAQTFTIINITQDTFNENVTLDDPKVAILQGGWNSTFTAIQSNTTIDGSLTISDGTLIVENIVLQ